MIYPKFLEVKDTIGVSAPSNGFNDKIDIIRLNNAKNNLIQKGYKILETNNVRKSKKGRSSSIEDRVNELESLYLNENIKSIICARGGDFLMEILPYLNFNLIKDNPKWIQGYSDITGLLYTITTKLDISTIYANNIASFAMSKWHKSLYNNLEILNGNIVIQESFDKYQSDYIDYINGTETYNLDTPVCWKNLNGEDKIKIKGRIIGGCIDVLINIIGTKYDGTKEFIEKYKEDGVIWYFDNAELTNEGIVRALWQFKQKSYFKYCRGIVFGRSGLESSCYGISFEEAIKTVLNELNIPIIINADIGHKLPQMTIINGSIATITCKDNKGTLKFELK